MDSYAQNTLQRLAHLRPEGERDGPKLPDCSFIIIILLLLFLIRCNSQTTQATELILTRTQIAPPILQSSPNKEGTQHGTIRVSKDSDGFLQHSPYKQC